ncbi:MAG: hypothetical protein P4N59_19410 [Negativicutes bacterium]|nr:hypothetical protein [Negativicutes bacterium]
MSRTVAWYEEFSGAEDKSNISFFVVLGVAVVIGIATVLVSNISLIGTEMLNNPFYPGF